MKFSDLNVTLIFVNNKAKLAGDAVYGGQIDSCYTLTYRFSAKQPKYGSWKIFDTIANLTQQNNISRSTISSSPYGACFCNTINSEDYNAIYSLNCSNMSYPREVIPGQTISIGAAAIGQGNGTVPISSVYFEFTNFQNSNDITTQLVVNNTFEANHPRTRRCNILNCVVYSNETRAVFKLTIHQISTTEVKNAHYINCPT